MESRKGCDLRPKFSPTTSLQSLPSKSPRSFPMSTTRTIISSQNLTSDNPPTRRTQLLAVQISMTVLALLVGTLRLVSRYMVAKNPWYDDQLICVAMVILPRALPALRARSSILDSHHDPNGPYHFLHFSRCRDALLGLSSVRQRLVYRQGPQGTQSAYKNLLKLSRSITPQKSCISPSSQSSRYLFFSFT